MEHLEILRKSLHEELEKTEKILASTKISRDNAPTAMESHSDETRSRLEGVITILELKVKEIKDYIKSIPTKKQNSITIGLWNYVEVELQDSNLKVFIVPEGFGGKKVDGIQFISNKTPIGSALLGKKEGDNFNFNNMSGKIISLD